MSPPTDDTPRKFRGPFGGRHSSQAISSPVSNVATPYNEYMSSTSSENSSVDSSPRELSDQLIEFIFQHNENTEPPRKRQKLRASKLLGKDSDLEHIVVHRGSWEIQCISSKLSDSSAERKDIGPHLWAQTWGSAVYIAITNDARQDVLNAAIPPNAAFDDLRLALIVHQETKKWARLQGRLWTEFEISLYRKNGLDCIKLAFAIKWNTTTSPYNVLQASSKTSALLKIM